MLWSGVGVSLNITLLWSWVVSYFHHLAVGQGLVVSRQHHLAVVSGWRSTMNTFFERSLGSAFEEKNNQRMNVNITCVHQWFQHGCCFWHAFWCWYLWNFSRINFQDFCHNLCCFPSQRLPLPCRRSQLVSVIAQDCPRSARWSVKYRLFVFLKVVFLLKSYGEQLSQMLAQTFVNLVQILKNKL